MENDDRYRLLLQKYLSNECTPSEASELFDHLGKKGSGRILLKSMRRQFDEDLRSTPVIPAEVRDRIRNRLDRETRPPAGRPLKLLRRKWLNAAAAALLILASAGLFLYFSGAPEQGSSVIENKGLVNDIPPGGNEAVLVLADGSQVLLNEAGDGLLFRQGNAKVYKEEGERLVYDLQGSEPAPAEPNTIITPRGGQYEIVLPDGTKVWLNASSTLRFPTSFSGAERNVELTGEAYFEVAEDPGRPFRVATKNMRVEVLGTHFNVAAYDDERTASATLLEGSVRVNSDSGDLLLKPGQQALLDKETRDLRMTPGDPEGAIAWKNGYFKFSNENIQSVMRKIARWYNVEVVYRGDVSRKAVWGTISRFENVSEVLQMLEMTRLFHFKIEERRIVVMP